jgi:peptidyl-prolyl cis-trans isomerase A (cyclophilin A)
MLLMWRFESVEIVRAGDEKWNAIEAFVGLKGARLKKLAALKAETEAKWKH